MLILSNVEMDSLFLNPIFNSPFRLSPVKYSQFLKLEAAQHNSTQLLLGRGLNSFQQGAKPLQ